MASIIKVDTIKDTSDNTLLTSSSGNVSISNDLVVDTDTLYVDSSNNRVGIGTSSPDYRLTIQSAAASALNRDSVIRVGDQTNFYRNSMVYNGSASAIGAFPALSGGIYWELGGGFGASGGLVLATNSTNAGPVIFGTNDTERMRIDSSGTFIVGETSSASVGNGTGVYITQSGQFYASTDSSSGHFFNRKTTDGNILSFRQDGTTEGVISVSGSLVTYGGFTGTHWSRLSDNSKPTILKGTILESLDEMMDWYQVQFDIAETDDEGNETTRTQKQSYALSDGESVGDVITYNYEGTDYQATIIQEEDMKHTKSKISDTVDAKNVYGVFFNWDNDDDTVNDMYVAQTGTFVIRINGSETVSKGDLIQSNGDGTGKVQADDIIRSSTVAKVLSTTKIETYDDGSYIVPCSLHC